MHRFLRIALWIVVILVTGLAFTVRVRYGGGKPYPDVTGLPILSGNELETVLSYPEPIGNVALQGQGQGCQGQGCQVRSTKLLKKPRSGGVDPCPIYRLFRRVGR